jgi:mRNA-degrading endonuclease RelE of RelBE toxin-antitoxin system
MSHGLPGRRVVLSRNAAKGVASLPEHTRRACANIIRELAAGSLRGKKLLGDLRDMRSIRIGGTHRLLYRETLDQIQVVDVGPRGDVYKR